MDLYDVDSYDMQTLLKLPPLQPSIELRRQQCASAAERRAPIAVPSAHDRASRMLDLERILGPSVFLGDGLAGDASRRHVTGNSYPARS